MSTSRRRGDRGLALVAFATFVAACSGEAPTCTRIALSPVPAGMRLVASETTAKTARFVYEDAEQEQSIGVLSGIPGELPTATDEIRERGVPVGGGLSAARIADGPVTFIVVWDERGELCEPVVVVTSGLTESEISTVEESLSTTG